MSNDRDIVNVTQKVNAFWEDRQDERHLWSILTSWEASEIGGAPAALGRCLVLREGVVMAEAHSTRFLRAPKSGAQGMNDTRDAERVQTQACGRAMGLLGYASGASLEGDTDEPDPHADDMQQMVPKAKAKGELLAALHGDTSKAAELWPFGTARFVSRDDLDDLLGRVSSPVQMAGEGAEGIDALGAPTTDGGDPVSGPDAGDAVTVPGTGPAAVRAALKEAKP